MKTDILEIYRGTPQGEEAEAILRSCVHCGFCTATCPTYQDLFDERDGPRGRIYLIKQLLETGEAGARTRQHLDRCLTCRSCETTCPSGVQYGRLIDIGRDLLETRSPRPLSQRLLRWGLRQLLPYPARLGPLLRLGQGVRPLLPGSLQRKVPPACAPSPWPAKRHPRVMLALAGCAQAVATPNTNAAAARVLDRLGISLVAAPDAGCCGAVSYHLSAQAEGLAFMRRNIDAWWPVIEAGCEAIVITASGCGAMIQEYGHLLRHDPDYADKAKKVSALVRDIGQLLADEDLSPLALKAPADRVALHCPCSLQHAMKQEAGVERVLRRVGFSLTKTEDSHLCCGSAGTYSILQPELSQRLLDKKLQALTGDNPQRIVTSNVGCQLHLASRATIPVQHWIELLDRS